MRETAANFDSKVSAKSVCPGCQSTELSGNGQRVRQPVIQNYLCATREQAIALNRGILELKECLQCGLIFNAAFEAKLVEYDASYDGQQGYSQAFSDHLDSVAKALADRYLADGGKVLDIGCGKGGFLRLLRDRGCVRCVGYDTSCPNPDPELDTGIEYHRSYVSAGDIQEEFDLIICRHVVCQVEEIGEFLRELARVADAAGGASVAIETPDFEWIVEHGSFWDVFYERCNYFPRHALAALCERAGFQVLRHDRVFGGQYQLIELKAGSGNVRAAPKASLLDRYADAMRKAESNLATAICHRRAGSPWAVWGAGGKGVTLCNVLGDGNLLAAIDANPAKQGGFLPGSAKEIISPDDRRIADLELILIANPNYEDEIRKALSAAGYRGEILVA